MGRPSTVAQSANFEFNVIVVDNHSTDRTTEILRGLGDSRVKHLVPKRRDLGIGGCWNEAIYSQDCGQYAIQLDSDDLYLNDGVMRRIVAELPSSASDFPACLHRDTRPHPKCRAWRRGGSRLTLLTAFFTSIAPWTISSTAPVRIPG